MHCKPQIRTDSQPVTLLHVYQGPEGDVSLSFNAKPVPLVTTYEEVAAEICLDRMEESTQERIKKENPLEGAPVFLTNRGILIHGSDPSVLNELARPSVTNSCCA